MGAPLAVVAAALFPLASVKADPAPPCPMFTTCRPPDGQDVQDGPSMSDVNVNQGGGWRVDQLHPEPLGPPIAPQKLATVTADVDVYNNKNEPDGAGQVTNMLSAGTQVVPVGNCAPESWCQVNTPDGASVGWVWGHLQLP